jgi:hypothetical protein
VKNELELDLVEAMASTRCRVASTPSRWPSESLRVSCGSRGSFRDGIVPHRKEFDTTLKVRLDTLRAELTREKDAAILSLKQAQDSQLEELKEYYTSRYASKVSEMQKLIDAKDAKIEELEAALGDPLSLWWKRVTGQEKKNPVQQKPPPPEPPTDLYSA